MLLTFNFAFSQTVYVTKTGKKYHDSDCVHLKRSSISISLEEAVERGYDACKVCKPIGTQNTGTKNNFVDKPSIGESRSSSSSVQCSGRTKKGSRCKRMTSNSSGRCYQH